MSGIGALMGKDTRSENCEKHGDFTSRNIINGIWTRCPKCSDEQAAADRVVREKDELRKARERWEQRMGHAGIPDRFKDRSLKSYAAETDRQRQALAFATEYADNFNDALETGRSALFLGKPGTGKTHLAVGIGLRIMHRDNRTVLFSIVMRAIRRVKDTWGRNSLETETEAIAALAFPDLLILDEFGIQFGSETEKLILFDLMNARYEQRRPTLMLSNLTLEEVKAYLGERIFDRMREDGGEVVVFDWDSHRARAYSGQYARAREALDGTS